MDLVIVESPAKAKTIEKYLGPQYKVIASVGHIIDLPSSELGVDIENGFIPTYTVIEGKEKVIEALKKSAKNADIIYLAPDPDREGEAIAWHIAEQILSKDKKKSIKRVLFNEITKKGVIEGIEHPGDINMNRVNAQQSRRILDRLVGYLVSPLLWRPLKSGLSAGRVQSVALRLVCEREREIETFVPIESWTIDAKFDIKGNTKKESGAITARLDKINGKKCDIKNEKEALKIIERFPKDYEISSVEKKEVKQSPTAPFITSRMQQEAIRKLGYTAKKAMTVAQQLYEGVELSDGPTGLITYMRTDSVRISPDAADECADFIGKTFGKEYLPKTKRVAKKASGNVQDAHEAIRPTSVLRTPTEIKKYLTADQYKLYKLIWERFVASQMADAVYDQTTVSIEGGEFLFKTSARVLKFAGFTKLYMESREEDVTEDEPNAAIAFDLVEKSKAAMLTNEKKQHFTQSPPRFTEASLVKTLEQQGIGRPSTYASIISTIIDRKYVDLKEKKFTPTELGRIVNNLLTTNFPKIFEAKFTARMEQDLDSIEEGKQDWKTVLHNFYTDFDVELKAASAGKLASNLETGKKCTQCETGSLIIKYGKNGAFLACSSYPECKFTSNFKREDNGEVILVEDKAAEGIGIHCEKCGAELVLKRSRFGEMIACPGYPECKNIKNFLRQSDGTVRIIEIGEKVKGNCPKCESAMIAKSGRNGIFATCEKYPECKSSAPVVMTDSGELELGDPKAAATDAVCEKCGKPMTIKRGPRGPFLACTGYPDCKNAKSLKAAAKKQD